jgi:hypothetical protein
VARRLDVDFFDLLDNGKGRAREEIVLEGFDALDCSFGQSFDPSIRQITHVSQNLMAGSGTLREETITDALHLSANQKFSRDFHLHPLIEADREQP